MGMKGVNKAILIGHVGQDPEVRYMPSGDAVCNCSLATSESWKDKNGQLQEKTEWHRIAIFGKLAEIAGEYLRKGSQVYFEGKLQTRKWEKDGADNYTTEIKVDSFTGVMQMLGSKSDGQAPVMQKQQPPAQSQPVNKPMAEPDFDFDSDIPF